MAPDFAHAMNRSALSCQGITSEAFAWETSLPCFLVSNFHHEAGWIRSWKDQLQDRIALKRCWWAWMVILWLPSIQHSLFYLSLHLFDPFCPFFWAVSAMLAGSAVLAEQSGQQILSRWSKLATFRYKSETKWSHSTFEIDEVDLHVLQFTLNPLLVS